jgi:hypothetical protein
MRFGGAPLPMQSVSGGLHRTSTEDLSSLLSHNRHGRHTSFKDD